MKDILVELLKKNIQRRDLKLETEEELFHQTSAEYMYHLMNVGHIPQQHLDTIEEEVQEELKIIYRKLTYGAFNLDNYREQNHNNRKRDQ